ncbi:MAG: signal recognition particle-docking protein FtsY [Oscillospiraceae bacterium]|nr:signal recognition particle-docking protein FtsY [Oscillospiraceae bacterium]MBQ6697968.1 signal recognition particle-docking protein FtsY [Oscillospiraceae bacterium]MBQ6901891.1 signal recognition particle-docking protein FtsY [Oscillospiraceae bacterium]
MGLFDKIKKGLAKTRESVGGHIGSVIRSFSSNRDEMIDELEETLIMADLGVSTAMKICETLRERIKEKKLKSDDEIMAELKGIILEILSSNAETTESSAQSVILIVGVNGVGKTTSIGKLASRFVSEGKKVILAAGDTFRAAAGEQLDIWAKRSGAEIIRHSEGADPAAVVFDAANAARARKADVLICDTAGRLHNNANLMNELAKIRRVLERELPDAKIDSYLVLDATTGQNALIQAKKFNEVANLSGIILTKLDGTAKGGIVISIADEMKLPIKYIGVGEGVDDLTEFDAVSFVDALFEQ